MKTVKGAEPCIAFFLKRTNGYVSFVVSHHEGLQCGDLVHRIWHRDHPFSKGALQGINGYDRISVDPEGAKRRECVSFIPGIVPSL